MPQYNGFKTVPKIAINDHDTLSLVYTPGVGASCLQIAKNPEAATVYTNKINSVAVIAFDYEEAIKRAIFLKSVLLIDAYPLVIKKDILKSDLKLAIENIYINFCAIDLSLIQDFVSDIDFNIDIPVLKAPVSDLKDFFGAIARNVFMLDTSNKNTLGAFLFALKPPEKSVSMSFHIDNHIHRQEPYQPQQPEQSRPAHVQLELLPFAQLLLHLHHLRLRNGDIAVDEVRHLDLRRGQGPDAQRVLQQPAAPPRPTVGVGVGEERRCVPRSHAVPVRQQLDLHHRVAYDRAVHPHRLHRHILHAPARTYRRRQQYDGRQQICSYVPLSEP